MNILYVDESGDDGFPSDNIFSSNRTPSSKFIRTGLIIHDRKWKRINDAVEHNIEKTHREFARAIYTQSSHVKEFHFIESIMFEPSESSNLLQLVDIASYASFRKFNSNDSSLYDELKERIMKNNQGMIEGAGLKVWPP